MSYLFSAAYINIFAIFSAMSTFYKSSSLTKMKWLGALSGLAINSIMIAIVYVVHGVLNLVPWGGIILVAYYVALIIINIYYNKKIAPRKGDFSYEESLPL